MSLYIQFLIDRVGNIVGQLVENDQSVRDEYARERLDKMLTGGGGVLSISPFGMIKSQKVDQKNKVIALQFQPALAGNAIDDTFVVPAKQLIGYCFFNKEDSERVGKLFYPSSIIVPKINLKGGK